MTAPPPTAGCFAVDVDAAHGGRIVSLRDPSGLEWLWSRPDSRRAHVRPSDSFVDGGGVEECLPTIGGEPDHGDAWSRPWTQAVSGDLVCETGAFRLARSLDVGQRVVAAYTLEAEPGWRFIWAFHALLEPDVGLRVHTRPGPARAWPDHVQPVDTSWPCSLGVDASRLGPDDGTAMFTVLPDRTEATVVRGSHALSLRLDVEDQPSAIGIWRNLGGYPWDAQLKYRNFGLEPMIGHVFDLSQAQPAECGVVPATGQLHWTLTIEATTAEAGAS